MVLGQKIKAKTIDKAQKADLSRVNLSDYKYEDRGRYNTKSVKSMH